jgi:hypothetical protein
VTRGQFGRLLVVVVVAGLLGVVAVALAPPASAQAADQTGVDGQGSEDLLGEVVPGGEPGRFPTSHYEVNYDAGVFDVMEKLQGWLTNVVFGLARWLVRIGIWVITWAYTFAFGNELAEPAGEMARLYEQRLVGPIGLSEIALFCAVVYAGWQIFRGRLPRGVGELAISLVVAAAGVVLLRNPSGVLDSGMELVGRLSGEVLSVTVSESPNGTVEEGEGHLQRRYEGLLQPLGAGIHGAYVEDPWELMSFGAPLDGTPCAKPRDAILALGPASPLQPWDAMEATPGCERYGEFSRRSTFERLAVATLVLFTAAVVMVLLVLVAGTVVVAQLVGVALVAVMPFAVVGGILPGSGRQLLWRWGSAMLRALLAILVMSFFLSFLLFSLRTLLDATAGRSLLERFGILLLLTVVLFAGRKRFLRSGQAIARNLGSRMERARVGGAGPGWLAPVTVAGATGFGLGQLGQEGRAEAREVTRPAGRLGRAVLGPATLHGSPRGSNVGGAAHAGRIPGGSGTGPVPRVVSASRRRGTEAASSRVRSVLDRAARTRPARAAALTARTARGAGRVVLGSTLNLPVTAPRAAVAAREAASARTAALRERLGSAADRTGQWAREWRAGALHPVRAYREQLANRHQTGNERGRR